MEELYKKLYHYNEKDIYPFHMPGHKRNQAFDYGFIPVRQDITEITDFDDLHHAEGIILEAEQFAAGLFGSREVFFSVNGSTAAVLASVSAAVKKSGKILVSRNCHKSLYHALYLRDIEPVYIFPETDEETGIACSIDPEEVERRLCENSDVEAVFITSPTYEGIVSDIRSIAVSAHRHGIPLIVDEAHGAHFVFSDYFPESAVSCGADLVIQSIHKTLPSLTGTAVLHRCSDRVSRDLISRFMSIYQTSSPSYPIMAGMDRCFHFLKEQGKDSFEVFTDRLENLRQGLKSLDNICLLDYFGNKCQKSRQQKKNHRGVTLEAHKESVSKGMIFDFDRSKVLLTAAKWRTGGPELLRIFHDRYRIEPEMAARWYVLCLTAVGDTEEGFRRLYDACADMDKSFGAEAGTCLYAEENADNEIKNRIFTEPVRMMSISEALDSEHSAVPLEQSAGRTAAEFVYLYPPGIPLIVPGEQISLQFVHDLKGYFAENMNITGLKDSTGSTIECYG